MRPWLPEERWVAFNAIDHVARFNPRCLLACNGVHQLARLNQRFRSSCRRRCVGCAGNTAIYAELLRLGPLKAASPSFHPPLVLRSTARQSVSKQHSFFGHQIRRKRAQGRDVVDDPDTATMCRQNQIGLARMHHDIAHSDVREVGPLRAHCLPPSREIHKPNSVPRNSSCRDRVLLDDVSVTAHSAAGRDERRPSLPVIGSLEGVRIHVAERVAIEHGEGGSFGKPASLHPGHPGGFRQVGNMPDDVRPILPSIAGDL